MSRPLVVVPEPSPEPAPAPAPPPQPVPPDLFGEAVDRLVEHARADAAAALDVEAEIAALERAIEREWREVVVAALLGAAIGAGVVGLWRALRAPARARAGGAP